MFSIGTEFSTMAWLVSKFSLKKLHHNIKVKMGSSFFITLDHMLATGL
jgi:hypothetical protein